MVSNQLFAVKSRAVWLIVLVVCVVAFARQSLEASTAFTEPADDVYQTDDGTVPLAWAEEAAETGPDRHYEIRRWTEEGPSEGVYVYEGQDTASFVSGLKEGRYEFRVRSRLADESFPEWGQQALIVEVEYIDMQTVGLLMSAGLVTFLALLVAIFVGRKSVSQEESTQT